MKVLPIPYFWQNAGHIQTVTRALFSKESLPYKRERIDTPDGDFLDLDWYPGNQADGRPLFVFCHGLEGDSASTYIPLTVRALALHHSFQYLAWNYRGCSGELNRRARFYHLGEIEDLTTVLRHARGRGFERIVLVGFSAGGSIVLNFLGRRAEEAQALGIVAAAAISAPIDMEGCARQLETPGSMFYNRRFCTSLAAKVQAKAQRLGEDFPLDVTGLNQVQMLRAFDERITAPLHGFASAAEYYARSSGLQYLPDLTVPTLLWAAKNDPFLSPSCHPKQALTGAWPNVQGHFPGSGGHCGYALSDASVLLAAMRPGGFWAGRGLV
ncbi:alpha/beta fold hydrolase [Nostoc sp. NIES-2111]